MVIATPSLISKVQGCSQLCGAFRLCGNKAIFIGLVGSEPRASEDDALTVPPPALGQVTYCFFLAIKGTLNPKLTKNNPPKG